MPLQLGVGVKGGLEVGVHTIRLLLEQHPDWAACSNDFKNGFNALSRDAMLQRLADGPFRHLLPMVESMYLHAGGLHVLGSGRLYSGSSEVQSTKGVRQGDPLGPLLFSLALHPTLQPASTN